MPRRRRTTHKLRERPRRSHWLLLAVGGLTLLWVLLAAPVESLLQHVKVKRQVAEAQSALEHRSWLKALQHAGAVLQAQPGHGEALLIAADAVAELGANPDEVLNLLKRAKAAEQTQAEVDLKLAQTHLRRGDLPAAQMALDQLPAEKRQGLLAAEVEAALLLAQGREPAMAARLREGLEAHPHAPGAAFRLAVLDLNAPDADRRATASQRLMQEARAQGEYGPQAIGVLLKLPNIPAEQVHELASLAQKLPPPTSFQLYYTALGILVRHEVGEKRAALLMAEEVEVSGRGAAAAFPYMLFLAAHHEAERLLKFIQSRRKLLAAVDGDRLLHLEVDALCQTRQWALVAEKLESPAASRLEPWSRHLWRACVEANEATPDPQRVRQSLEAAFVATERGRHAVNALYLADTAVLLGQHDFALMCYEVLFMAAKLPAEQIRLLEKIGSASAHTQNTGMQLYFARQLAGLTPGHEGNAFRLRYLELLLNPSRATLDAVESRNAAARADPDAVTTSHQHLLMAMAMHRRQQMAGLLEELQGLEHAIAWPAGPRAVIAGLLAYAGETARAFQIAEKVPATLLLPEEKRMLDLAR